MGVFDQIKEANVKEKVRVLSPHLKRGQKVLDFGCGDLSLSTALCVNDRSLKITGVDVVDFGVRTASAKFTFYDGKKLPYKNASFDAVISYHVLHHTDNPFGLLQECTRVCGKRLLIVEPVFRCKAEVIGMSIMDWIFNVWKDRTISMTYAYKSKAQWIRAILKNGFQIEKIVDVEMLPAWMPTGRSILFVCTRRRSA